MAVSEGSNTADVETRVNFIKPRALPCDISYTDEIITALLVPGKVVELLLIYHPCLECMLRQTILE